MPPKKCRSRLCGACYASHFDIGQRERLHKYRKRYVFSAGRHRGPRLSFHDGMPS